jgi:PAS domain S-box-containing protein/diguanylate cyclase (GGDEF)-like protein
MASKPKKRSPAIKRTPRRKKGDPKGAVSGARGLPKQEKAKDTRPFSDAVAAQILDLSDEAIISVDEAQAISRFNKGAARIFGYTQDEIVGRSLVLLLPDQFVEAHRGHIARFAVSPVSSHLVARRGRVWGRRKDGSEFPAEATISKLEVAGKKTFTVFLRDVTGRWNLEQELERKNSILSTQNETSLDATVLVDEDGKIVSFNQKFVDLWAIPGEVIESQSDERAIQSVLDKLEQPQEFVERVRYLYDHKEEKSQDVIRTKDGRSIERFTSPVFGHEGRYFGRVWYFRDITERQRAEDALRRTVTELSEAQRVAHVGSWRLDLATDQVVWSEELYRMLHLEPESTPPPYTEHQRLFAPESWEQLNAALLRTRETGVPYELELEMVRADGSRGWMLARGEPLRDEDNRIIALRGTAQDITDRKRAEQNLQQREVQLRAFLNESPSLMFMKDMQGRYVFVNDRFKQAFGLRPEQILFHTDAEIFPQEQATRFVAQDARALSTRSAFVAEEVAHYLDGPHTSLTAKFPIFDVDGTIINLGGIATDVTDWKRAVVSLERANRALRVLSAVNQALTRAESEHALLGRVCDIMVDLGGYRMAWIGFLEHDEGKSIRPVAQTGYEAGYLQGVAITWADTERGRGPTGTAARTGKIQVSMNIGSDPRMAVWRDDALKRGYASSIALPLVHETVTIGVLSIYARETDAFQDDEVRLLEELAADLAFGIVTHRSLVERHRAEARAERLANYDLLTELPNRVQLIIRLGAAIEDARLHGYPLALLTLGIDRFSEIQDGIGIAGADELLKNVASRLLMVAGEGNFLARIAGELFALVIPKADARLTRMSAARLQEIVSNPFEFAGIPLDVQATIGVALYPAHGADPDSLIRRSDIAIRQARAAGTGYAVYSGENETESPSRLTLLADLRRAIKDDGLVLFYQPKIDVLSGTVCGVEALVRWQHPERGLVPPNDFIPLAEHTGLIRPITYWVMEAALKQIADWRRLGIEIPIAMNVSPNNLRDPEFLEHLEALRANSGASFDSLELELTETAVMEDPARSHAALARIGDMGARISIDDFGTGHSSLSYIATLPVHALKIDRSFVLNMMQQPRHRAVVAAAISLAHSLGLRVVAEGIETAGQAEALIGQGCDELQGYFFCKPLPADQFVRWQAGFVWEQSGLAGPKRP